MATVNVNVIIIYVDRADSGRKDLPRMGFVLAGGRSSRMGCDKALLAHRGKPLLARIAGTVEAAAGTAVVVGSPEKYGGLGHPVIPDLYPGEGPLGGILTALSHSTAPWNLITACDLPDLTVEFLDELFERAEASAADIVVPAEPSGRDHPLCAIYHLRAQPALARGFASGIRKVTAAFDAVRVLRLPVPETAVFHNINTPQDWADYAGN